jgi:hypothetical protein
VENEAYYTATGTGFGGGVLFNVYSASTNGVLVNNLFYNNVGHNSVNQGNSVACIAPGVASVYYCDAFSDGLSNTDAYHYTPDLVAIDPDSQEQNSIHVQPTFVGGGDYHLVVTGDTPIDKGHDPGAAPYDKVPTTDRDGEPDSRPKQIESVPDGNGGTCDMGAYETQH